MTLDQLKIDNIRMIAVRPILRSGSIPGKGLYGCVNCSVKWLLDDYEDLPECPECGSLEFQKEYYKSTL